MKRKDKGKAVTRYIGAVSGIPTLHFDPASNHIDAPPPYRLAVSTDGAWWRLAAYLKDLPEDAISAVVRYDGFLTEGGVDNAIVATRLSTFATLLECHYNSIQDRVTTYIEGD